MSTNYYSWNKKLKFSWGHIIAFVALIFISYITYMGAFYANGGNFSEAAITVLIIDSLLIITFIGAQLVKGTNQNFDLSIKIERMLIVLCPIVFVGSMIPYNHFWNVYSERNKIEKTFCTSIEKSKTMFTDYNAYANTRIENYNQYLTDIINNKNEQPYQYRDAGFSDKNENIRKENYIKTLQLQLLSQNTDSMQTLALEWIEKTNQGANVWNVFRIGNIDKISSAIKSWNSKLDSISKLKMRNEPDNVKCFNYENDSYNQALVGLQQLKEIYKTAEGFNVYTMTGFILFLMLLLPYFLQNRNTRANGLYRLIPIPQKWLKKKGPIADPQGKTKDINKTDLYDGTF